MFREMRRKNQMLDEALCYEILNERENGVLAVMGDDDYPYAVPLNHVLFEGKLYFHGACEGHKADALKRCDKASYCVIDADEVDQAGISTRFRSVIAFGRARMLEDEKEKRNALTALARRFLPDNLPQGVQEIEETLYRTGVIKFTIEHLSGKESRALAKERREGRK